MPHLRPLCPTMQTFQNSSCHPCLTSLPPVTRSSNMESPGSGVASLCTDSDFCRAPLPRLPGLVVVNLDCLHAYKNCAKEDPYKQIEPWCKAVNSYRFSSFSNHEETVQGWAAEVSLRAGHFLKPRKQHRVSSKSDAFTTVPIWNAHLWTPGHR
jgi:hypothetical protein